jgi:predicted SnoaL-like aldol condensation-catalyzing enzyme
MFVQHNPQVADGAKAFIGFVNSIRSQFPGMHLEKASYNSGQDGSNALPPDANSRQARAGVGRFFRFEADKVVEHWDVIQEIPDASANSNGMF